jgi:DNA-binding NtrC family response regulator
MLDILLVDDEPTILASVSDALRDDGHRVSLAHDGAVAMAMLNNQVFDLLICDIRLPRVDGMGIFRHVKLSAPSTDIIFITAFGAVPDAVAALKEGATDYLTKPFRLETLRSRVAQIDQTRTTRDELLRARATLDKSDVKKIPMVGQSPVLRRALEHIEMFARSDYPVLITGETGTGKELVAQMLHTQSGRRQNPMVAVNCAAFPETLIEAELFGYRRGAFTGAFADREGRFKAAHGGTLFLDEIAEMPLAAQAKLLRVLQEGCFEPLGTNQSVRVNVRIFSATHRCLRERVAQGSFREDLYYRLKVLAVDVPPLRERRGDLSLLVGHFLNRAPGEDASRTLSARAMAAITAYPFPGNIRELEHALQHAGVLAAGKEIDACHLPSEIAGDLARDDFNGANKGEGIAPLPEAMQLFEREYLMRALHSAGGGRTRAAAALGISRKNLWQKLRRHGLLDFSPGDDAHTETDSYLDRAIQAH